jgi:hypothetical protein|tara:strand:- start:72 stop:191 length:120 start_codon:yes stop_codon:yes gene_type:complete
MKSSEKLGYVELINVVLCFLMDFVLLLEIDGIKLVVLFG